MRKEQIEDPKLPLRIVSLSHVALLHALFCMLVFHYSCGILTVTLHARVRPDSVTTPSTGGITAGRQVLYHAAAVLLLYGRHRLDPMQQVHEVGDVGLIQQHILVCLIAREDRVAIS